MAEPKVVKMGPGARNHGPRAKIDNPGKLLKRMTGYILKDYKIHLVIVVICIFVSVLANVQGTMFTKTLIDGYITPMLLNKSTDFTPLLNAILRVAVFYLMGAFATYIYNRELCATSEKICLITWRAFQSAILTHMHMVTSCRYIPTILIHFVR